MDACSSAPHTRPLRKLLVCLGVMVLAAGFDYFTGYEVTSFPIYLLPILLSTFYFGKAGGYIAVFVASGCWVANDYLSGHHYASEVIRFWNAFSRLFIYSLFVYGVSVYVKTQEVHRQRLEAIRRLIPMCHGCGKVFWKDGTWKTPREALEAANREIAECPDCAPEAHRNGRAV